MSARITSRDYARIAVALVNGGGHTVRLAGLLAQQFDATLIGMAGHDMAPANSVLGSLVMPNHALLALAQQRARRHIADMEDLFRHEGRVCTRLEWVHDFIAPSFFVANQACLADLIVMRKPRETDEARFEAEPDIADVLLNAGRPVLVAPPDLEHLSAQRIVVAWKNTREARRAVVDALPFLVRAEEVIVAAIGDEAGHASEARLHLESHGVKCRSVTQALECDYVADQLELIAERERADLIVSGAYGRSKAREWVLGGVTRDLLRNARRCCFMSH